MWVADNPRSLNAWQKLALNQILTKFGQWDDDIISKLQAIFQLILSSIALGEMFICSKIGAKSFGDGSQDVR